MYQLDLGFENRVSPGTMVLLDGPAICDKQARYINSIDTGLHNSEQVVLITFDDRADHLFQSFEDVIDTETQLLTVIDCVSQQHGTTNVPQIEQVQYCDAPSSLTQVGMKFTEAIQRTPQQLSESKLRIVISSLSTAFMYNDAQDVFSFLNEIRQRIKTHEAVCVATINYRVHDENVENKTAHLFDTIVRVQS